MPRRIDGLAAIAGECDALVLDQWGVLHDGHHAYPGAVDGLTRLRAAGLRVIILSNSGKSGEENARLIERMGFDRGLFDAVVSAGDAAIEAIRDGTDDVHARLGPRALLLARPADHRIADRLGAPWIVDSGLEVDEADFLLLMSMDAPRQSVQGWEPLLRRAAARGLPMVCANPDVARVTPDGDVLEAPGLVARRYVELGGAVSLHGKPDPGIFRQCLDRLACMPTADGVAIAPGRVLVVGDSLHHDVLGARRAGLRSLLITSGVHQGELGGSRQTLPDEAALQRLYAEAGVRPDLVAPAFRW